MIEIDLTSFVIITLSLAVGLTGGYYGRRFLAESRIRTAEEEVAKMLDEAAKEVEAKKKEILLEAKDEIHRNRQDAEKDIRERRRELDRVERRIIQKEEMIDKKTENMEKKEQVLLEKEKETEKTQQDLQMVLSQQLKELERLSGLSSEEAKELLLYNVSQQIRQETAVLIRNIENEAKEEADKKAKNIVSLAIQKCAADVVSESTVSVVPLPNDEMKGRIIGREGRNIRTFEALSGVDLIIDDTPEAVILSSFDPIRREVARVALGNLVSDGRIHPARIEEMVEKARKEIEQEIREVGEQAAFEVGVHGLHPELIKLLGRLKYRTSYGQNVLRHSVEVAHLAGIMAAELEVDIMLAKRSGLLHDIGKAVDHEVSGPHVEIGVDLAKKYRENKDVIHGIEAHHGDIEPETVEAVLVQAADAISASRPGARRETLETYIKRLEKLENVAESFSGVDRTFAIQAGREIRIIVKPEEIDDLHSINLARDIAAKIEQDLDYPGQIKVVVIRETRSVEYAK
ncbi:metal dependent phosphohydrolase [Syntrophomonas wolfei subsp. wolfei str. Goettingen G311]|uniref:Ribonuclease Y n=1 Tax=Syntrophomonas wolfei subsp. wolfei (strain DSM 2245B / Goettingen) TaxID=335541 RepID=RNY_SYNWW|nr:RecName: Full=Ribonuclease Y; Short=RNase Y [Syntrophomonas wolfei subsp. wolfei str. Goettingen G311]ABI68563.1 metal dependent phosphohydrolase [Syntrophomonas wolfei subsp. wolfei str. Goettingen G311]